MRTLVGSYHCQLHFCCTSQFKHPDKIMMNFVVNILDHMSSYTKLKPLVTGAISIPADFLTPPPPKPPGKSQLWMGEDCSD